MGGSNKSSQSTQATQTTTNNDNSIDAGENGTVVGGAGSTVTINDLSADVAGKAIDLAGDTTNTAFGYLSDAGMLLTQFLQQQSTNLSAEKLNNQELTANLAQQSFDLADEKSQSADDKVFSFGRVALYVIGGLAALGLLFLLFRKKSS